MPPVSPILDNVLNRWYDRGSDLSKDISIHFDRLASFCQGIDDGWLAYQDRRGRDMKELEESERGNDTRWTGRLRHLQDWQIAVSQMVNQGDVLVSITEGFRWFDKAERLVPSLAHHFTHRVAQWDEHVQTLHSWIEEWIEVLNRRTTELKEFNEKANQQTGPFLVSRARKQPEVAFVEEQNLAESMLGNLVTASRRAMNHLLGRLYKAGSLLENHARANPALFEIRKNQILEDLKESYSRIFALRERVLTEALRYEACRQKLRWIKEAVKGMRCIEDVYKVPEPAWKRWLFRGVDYPRQRK